MDGLKGEIVKELSDHINDLVLRSHQAKGKELSGLVADLRKDFAAVKGDITVLRSDLGSLSNNLEKLEIKIEYEIGGQKNRLSLIEKILFGAVGLILLTVLGAWMAQIII